MSEEKENKKITLRLPSEVYEALADVSRGIEV